MQLRTVLFCSFLVVPALAACGDDSGGGGAGGDASTTGATVTSSPAANSSSAAGEGGDPTGAGGDPAGTGGGTGGNSEELDCDYYCDTVMAACDGDLQYPDGASCRAACAAFPEGSYGDSDGTLGCHQYHANAAKADPVVHCGHAGPTGNGACAEDPCENFCEIAPEICPEQWDSPEICQKVCESFDVGDFSVSPPASGDTLGCRFYHLTVAAQSAANAEEHCAHTLADSEVCN